MPGDDAWYWWWQGWWLGRYHERFHAAPPTRPRRRRCRAAQSNSPSAADERAKKRVYLYASSDVPGNLFP